MQETEEQESRIYGHHINVLTYRGLYVGCPVAVGVWANGISWRITSFST